MPLALHDLAAQALQPAPTTETPPPWLQPWLLVLVFGYVLLLVLSVLIPVVKDISEAYSFARTTRKEIIDKVSATDLSIEKLRLILDELNLSPPGIPGLGRSTMALTIILILGIGVVHLLVIPSNLGPNTQIVGNVLSLLGGALASIIGFYFGGKTTQEAAHSASQAAQAVDQTQVSRALPTALVITTPPQLPAGNAGQPYTSTITASGGTQPYRWELAGTPPAGVSLDRNSGVLTIASPNPTGPNPLSITVQVSYATDDAARRVFKLEIQPAPQQ
jgi:hypothetical protein